MTPVLLQRLEIDDVRWDRLIGSSKQSVIYAHTFYLDAVCSGWQALVWPDRSDYKIVMPLPVIRKWGKTVVYQPFFCQYLGLFSIDDLSKTEVLAFMKCLSSHFSYISSYHFNPENFQSLYKIKDQLADFTFVTQHTHWLNLGKSYEHISQGYSADRMVNVHRSKKEDWTFESGDEIATLIGLFKTNHAQRIPGGVSERAYEVLKAIFNATKSRGLAEVWYAKKGNSIHAGLLLVKCSGRIIYLANASDQTGRKGNARSGMLDLYFLKQAGERLVFDFESPEVSQIADFYKSFGSFSIPYFKVHKNQLWFPLRQIQNYRIGFFSKPNKVFAKALIRFKIHFKRADL